ncbi:hypothetical protein GCM10023320_28080 [Pseudonocardia adelaidensis]|uniref:Uncharacterized protein n=1 Tax=Pseudonocardia adelaidensis TaxID=648754 RepID=A0ABP9NLB0_9PSEU
MPDRAARRQNRPRDLGRQADRWVGCRPLARELADNATAVATSLAVRVPDEHGRCRCCTRPGTGYRVASLALLARDIRARVTARWLMVVNDAATGHEGEKR